MTLPDLPPLEIDPGDLADLRARGQSHAILDVREPWEVAICGFADGVHVPLAELPGRTDELPRDRPLIVVCHHGQRSLLATRHLRRLGFGRATSLRGGVEAWARDVDPAMPRY